MMHFDPWLVRRKLPFHAVRSQLWQGAGVVTIGREGVPNGLDRVIYLWAATRGADDGPVFRFDLAEVPRMFGLGWSREETVRRLRRVAGAALERVSGNLRLLEHTIAALELDGDGGRVTLGRIEPRAADRDVVLALVRDGSMATLDQYLWQCEVAWTHRDTLPVRVPIDHVVRAIQCKTAMQTRARQQVRERQQLIASRWQGCPNRIVREGKEELLEVNG